MDQHSINKKINEQLITISKAKANIGYLKAMLYLIQLQGSETCDVPTRHLDMYRKHVFSDSGDMKMLIFPDERLTDLSSNMSRVENVKLGIKTFESMNELGMKPRWANNAIRNAKIVDEWLRPMVCNHK